MNPLNTLLIVFAVTMLGVSYSVSVTDKAKYQCVAEVSKTQQVDKAKELCK